MTIQNRMGRIGTNMLGISYADCRGLFIDRMKQQGDLSGTNFSASALDYPVLAANGYVQSGTGVDNYGAGVTTRWVLDYTCTGDLTIQAVQQLGTLSVVSNPAPVGGVGQMTFDLTNFGSPSDSSFNTVIFRYYTISGGSITSQHLYPISQVGNSSFVNQRAQYLAGEEFTAEGVAYFRQFPVIRFLDPFFTNAVPVVSWATRPTAGNRSYSSQPLPLEVAVRLCNRVKADFWNNIPVKADDDYIRQQAMYVRDSLDPSLVLYSEYGNEMWNGPFYAYAYGQTAGAALGQAQNPQQTWGAYDYNGARSAQAAIICNDVFKTQRHRLLNVLNVQGPGMAESYCVPAMQVLGIDPREIDILASTFYVEGGLQGGNEAVNPNAPDQVAEQARAAAAASDNSQIVTWAGQGATGRAAGIKQITGETALLSDNGATVPARKSIVDQFQTIFQTYGWAGAMYEGNCHFLYLDRLTTNTDLVVSYVKALVQEPDMRTKVFTPILNYAKANYFDTMMIFGDIGSSTKYGTWGVAPDLHYSGTPYPLLQVAGDHKALAPSPPNLSFANVATSGLRKVGSASTTWLRARGGTLPYNYEVASGTLPPGQTLIGGKLSGTHSAGSAGTYTPTIRATDRSAT